MGLFLGAMSFCLARVAFYYFLNLIHGPRSPFRTVVFYPVSATFSNQSLFRFVTPEPRPEPWSDTKKASTFE